MVKVLPSSFVKVKVFVVVPLTAIFVTLLSYPFDQSSYVSPPTVTTPSTVKSSKNVIAIIFF